jgi:hypothetical protein
MAKPLGKDEAKKYFIKMGCSHFHMARENPDYYSRYMACGVGESLEALWRGQVVKGYFENFPFDQPSRMACAYRALSDSIDYNHKYLERMLDLTNVIFDKIPSDQVSHVLSEVVGNYDTPTHGGLIEKSMDVGRPDICSEFIVCAKKLIQIADQNREQVLWLRGYLADILESLKISDDNYIQLLRKKDYLESYRYYEVGANEGNVFSMRMLSKYYESGRGCEIDTDKAIYWLTEAANSGNELAKKELSELLDSNITRKKSWLQRLWKK